MEEEKKYKVAPKPLLVSKCFIDACLPYEWKDDWCPVARSSSELRVEILKRYEPLLKGLP